MAMTDSDPLLVRAFRGEAVERTPVWAMRQAGRWDPEFRRLRGDRTFYDFSENAELAAQASLCPRRFGVDAIILFYDITTLAVAMGQAFELVPGRGPVPKSPIRSLADVRRLTSRADPASYHHVLETLRIIRAEVGRALSVLVFAGAPFTMAAYQTGVGKDARQLKTFAKDCPDVWRSLLEKTAEATVAFLRSLLEAGADAYQLFDSWAGDLSRDEYLVDAHAYHEQVFREVEGTGILFVKDLPFVDLAAASGCRVVSLGTAHDLASLKSSHPQMIWQGNVDHELLIDGTPDDVRATTLVCLAQGGGDRHILNLDHGMDPRAKVENFAAFVNAARK